MRPSVRLSALMKIRALEIFTHDSIALGEDGPTHQSVEHLWALRMIPNLTVWRPADGVETAMAWSYAVGEGDPAPHALCFSRQTVDPVKHANGFDPKEVWKGGYVLEDRKNATVAIIATGSEVGTAQLAAQALEKSGILARVVSMPAVERFLAQPASYRESVVPSSMKKVTVELGRTGPWCMITGSGALHLGIDQFGESAPWEKLREHFHMTPDAIAASIQKWLA
jgi:transketolase